MVIDGSPMARYGGAIEGPSGFWKLQSHPGDIEHAPPVLGPAPPSFNPAKNDSGKTLEMVWNQREGLLLGGFS